MSNAFIAIERTNSGARPRLLFAQILLTADESRCHIPFKPESLGMQVVCEPEVRNDMSCTVRRSRRGGLNYRTKGSNARRPDL
jgi:hypothetical protein